MKRAIIVIAGMFLGGFIISVFYENYIDKIYESYLTSEFTNLEYTSDVAFHELAPAASRFIQIQNSLVIHRANKQGLIDSATYIRLKALFSTRACINYEDQNNSELSSKMCELARQDVSLWSIDRNFDSFRIELVDKRENLRKSRESNKQLHEDRAKNARPVS